MQINKAVLSLTQIQSQNLTDVNITQDQRFIVTSVDLSYKSGGNLGLDASSNYSIFKMINRSQRVSKQSYRNKSFQN